MDTRGKSGDRAQPSTAEVGTDTGSVEVVELGEVGRQRRGSGPVALRVAGAVLVLAFGGAVALLRPPAPSPGPTNSAAAFVPTPAPTATAEPTRQPIPTRRPTPEPGPWVWQPYSLAGFDPSAEIRHLWALPDRFVALIVTPVGEERESELHSLLISLDGSAWTRAVLPAPAFEVEADVLADGMLWLIGTAVADGGPARQAWSTDDGLTWSRAESLEAALAGVESVRAFAHSAAGWVVVCEPIVPPDAMRELRIRHAADDGTWTEAAATLRGSASVVGLATDGEAFVLALEDVADETDSGFQILHSIDGGTWTSYLGLGHRPSFTDLTHGMGGYVLVGEDRNDDGTAIAIQWHSDDGTSWAETQMPIGQLPPGLSPPSAYRIVPTSRGYLATSQSNGMAWTSADAISWAAFNVWPSVNDFMNDVAVVGDVVVVGTDMPGRLQFLRGDLAGMLSN